MNLQLKSTFIDSMSLTKVEEVIEEKDGFDFDFGAAYSEQSPKTFQIFFKINLDAQQNNHSVAKSFSKLNIKFIALFELDCDITDDFREGFFPRVNAPAIAYPYLRSFVSTTLLNAGFEPIMLPSVNFQAIFKNENL